MTHAPQLTNTAQNAGIDSYSTPFQHYTVTAIPAFADNYIWCIHNNEYAAMVDPGDAQAVSEFLQQHKLKLCAILITHHHHDHTGGVVELSQMYSELPVYGPDNPKIKGITQVVHEGQSISLAELNANFRILETPGHTLDHIVYVNDAMLFCGDTLFSAGCGRMFEGTPAVFLASLQKLAALPEHIAVFCTHEYTVANLKFATHVDPHNQALLTYQQWATNCREHGNITLPSNIAEQKAINPFLRCEDASIQKNISTIMQVPISNERDTFAALRACKDNF